MNKFIFWALLASTSLASTSLASAGFFTGLNEDEARAQIPVLKAAGATSIEASSGADGFFSLKWVEPKTGAVALADPAAARKKDLADLAALKPKLADGSASVAEVAQALLLALRLLGL